MKTILPSAISTKTEAETFLTDLHNNNESFHPEDDATDIEIFSENEGNKLNELMNQIYLIDDFDPCEFLLNLINHY
jgi:hypothetical protein